MAAQRRFGRTSRRGKLPSRTARSRESLEMVTRNEGLAFWLVPAPVVRDFFVSIIGELAARLDGPVFEPHLTLFGGIINHDRTMQVFRTLPIASSYHLEIEGIFSSTKYTKTLFVRFHLSDELRELRRAITDALDLEVGDDFDPHLSLLYKSMTPGEQEELARSIKIPFQQARFEGLKAIAHPAQIATRADVEAWREIGRRSPTRASS